MAAPRGSRPFVRGGVSYPSQYAYRKALAARSGFASPKQRVKAVQAAKQTIARYTTTLSPEQASVLAAQVADWQGKLGTFREGADVRSRASNRLPPELFNALKRLGGDAYPIWRTLYQ